MTALITETVERTAAETKLPSYMVDALFALTHQRQKIAAIKLFRGYMNEHGFNVGLKNSKDFIEQNFTDNAETPGDILAAVFKRQEN